MITLNLTAFFLMTASGCYTKVSQDALLGGVINPIVAAPYNGSCGDGIVACTSDSFNRPNSAIRLGIGSTNLDDAEGTIIPGAKQFPYFIINGTWGINANTGVPLTLVSFDAAALVSIEFADCTIDLTINTQPTGGGLVGLMFRHDFSGVDNNNTWAVYADETNVLGSGVGYVLRRTVNSVATTQGFHAGAPLNGDTIQVVTSGSSIIVKLNSVPIITTQDANLKFNTLHGFDATTNIAGTRIGAFDIVECH